MPLRISRKATRRSCSWLRWRATWTVGTAIDASNPTIATVTTSSISVKPACETWFLMDASFNRLDFNRLDSTGSSIVAATIEAIVAAIVAAIVEALLTQRPAPFPHADHRSTPLRCMPGRCAAVHRSHSFVAAEAGAAVPAAAAAPGGAAGGAAPCGPGMALILSGGGGVTAMESPAGFDGEACPSVTWVAPSPTTSNVMAAMLPGPLAPSSPESSRLMLTLLEPISREKLAVTLLPRMKLPWTASTARRTAGSKLTAALSERTDSSGDWPLRVTVILSPTRACEGPCHTKPRVWLRCCTLPPGAGRAPAGAAAGACPDMSIAPMPFSRNGSLRMFDSVPVQYSMFCDCGWLVRPRMRGVIDRTISLFEPLVV